MAICGIIAEYDPFHTGHGWQIKEIRNTLGEDCAVIAVMSGNWTQRGGPALADKHTRARMALLGGADLVLELPLPYAISSAEGFAQGGVSVLNATGIVTHLCFGSECGDLALLSRTAQALDSRDYLNDLHKGLDQGLSFPIARQQAARHLIGADADCLSLPNNNLGVEYLRALNRLNSSITPVTVQRKGAGHGQVPEGGFASASWLRQQILEDNRDAATSYLLPEIFRLLCETPTADYRRAERAILYRLRQMSPEELAALPDCGEGLANRLFQAIRQGTSTDEILNLVKTKRYTHARLRRILLWAFLGLTATDRPETPPYLRVLGTNDTGRTLLRSMNEYSSVPVLTKPAHVRNLSAEARHLFELESRATDLYGFCLPELPPCGPEWTRNPVLI